MARAYVLCDDRNESMVGDSIFWAWLEQAPPAFFAGLLCGAGAFAWAQTIARMRRYEYERARIRNKKKADRLSLDDARRIDKKIRKRPKNVG